MKKYVDMCHLERRIFRISEIVDLQRRLAHTKPIQAGRTEVGKVIKEDRSEYKSIIK